MTNIVARKTWLVIGVVAFVMIGSMGALATNENQQKPTGDGGLYGGTLNIAIKGTMATSFDPRKVSDDASWNVFYRIFDTLVVYDQNDLQPVPWMIKDIGSYSGGKYTITLKDNIFWHTGTRVTGDDVKTTFENNDMKNNPRFKEALSHVSSVSATGSSVSFTLSTAYAPFVYDVLGKVPILPKDFTTNTMVGSGPFVFDKKSVTDVTLKKNENYFATPTYKGPYVDQVIFKYYPDDSNATASAFQGMKAGTIDYIMWGINPYEIEKGSSVITTQDLGFYFMGFNTSHKPLDDVKLRHALAMCCDKKNAVLSISNFGKIGSAVISSGNTFWFNDKVQNDWVWIHDVTGDGLVQDIDVITCLAPVRENLTKADYLDVDGDGRRDMPGSHYPDNIKSFSLITLAPTATLNPQEDSMTSGFISNMRSVGISINNKTFDSYKVRDSLVNKGAWDMYFDSYNPTSPDPSYIYNLFHSKGADNKFKYKNTTLDTMIENANKEMDPTTRQTKVKEIQAIIAQDIPATIIYYPLKIEAVKASYDGWIKMAGGIGNIWSFLNVHKPMVGSLDIQIETDGRIGSGSTLPVKFTVMSGEQAVPNATIEVNVTDGSMTQVTGLTASDGTWTTNYHAPSVSTPKTVTITVRAFATQYNEALSSTYITVSPSYKKFIVKAEIPVPSVDSGKDVDVTITVNEELQGGTAGPVVPDATVSLEILYLPTINTKINAGNSTKTDSNGKMTFKFNAKVDTDTTYTLRAKAVKANWTMSDKSDNILAVPVVAPQVVGPGVPALETVGILAAVVIAFVIVTVAFRNRRKEK